MKHLENILSNFKNKKIVIVGDIMLDRYLEGSVSRINPEAPVPIVSLKKEFNELGGAANVASNISALGGDAVLFGFVGKDKNAEIIKDLLKKKQITFFLDEDKLTIEKTRILGEGQQLLRFDNEETTEKWAEIGPTKEYSDTVQPLIEEFGLAMRRVVSVFG